VLFSVVAPSPPIPAAARVLGVPMRRRDQS
jgi:hypothetical protein